jgi:hypothetical protein
MATFKGPTAYAQFQAQDGNQYSTAANGFIYNVPNNQRKNPVTVFWNAPLPRIPTTS